MEQSQSLELQDQSRGPEGLIREDSLDPQTRWRCRPCKNRSQSAFAALLDREVLNRCLDRMDSSVMGDSCSGMQSSPAVSLSGVHSRCRYAQRSAQSSFTYHL